MELLIFNFQFSIYEVDVYAAIDEMRRLSARRESFSFSYMSYSISRRASEGIITVRRARLCPQSRRERNQYSDYMLNYIDLATGERHTCWQPLLLTFNDQELELQ